LKNFTELAMAATHKNMRQENRPLFVFNQKLINGSYGRSRFIQVYNYNSLMTEVLSKSGYVGLLPIRDRHQIILQCDQLKSQDKPDQKRV
jgi:hypothetical protein